MSFLNLRRGPRGPQLRQGARYVAKFGGGRGHTHVLCSLATGPFIEMLAAAAPSFEEYARVQGYDLVLSAEALDPGRPPAWSKLALVRELLEHYEVVIWLDADTAVVRFDEPFPEPSGDQIMALVPHPQERVEEMTVPNTGVFCVRRSPETLGFLAEWAGAPDSLNEHNWWDNAAFLQLLGYSLDPPYAIVADSQWRARMRLIGLRWNSVPGYCAAPDPVVMHHARADHGNDGRRLAGIRADVAGALKRQRQRSR